MRAQVPALLHRAVGLQKAGDLAGAQAVYEHILSLQPRRADVLHMLAVIAAQRNDFPRAAQLLGEVIAVEPGNAAAHSDRGVALKGIGQLEAALASLERAIGLAPDYAAAYSNRGNVLLALEQPASALASFERALALKPDYAEAHYNRGIALQALQQREAALASYDRAPARRPPKAAAHRYRALLHDHLWRRDAGPTCDEAELALKPECAEAHLYRGNVLRQQKQPAAALASYEEAIRLNPGHPAAHLNRAVALYDLRDYEAAIASLRRARALKHTPTDWHGLYLFLHAAICDWYPLDADLGELRAAYERLEAEIDPVLFVALCDSEVLQLQAARGWAQRVPGAGALPPMPWHARHDRIRVGYFSPDFHGHPVAQCVAELIECHDRSRFEVTAFSFGVDNGDAMRKRLEKAFDRFIDVRLQSDQEIARLARGLEIDLAVDLAGFTDSCRPAIFTMRAAPLQISYVGYPATTGAD